MSNQPGSGAPGSLADLVSSAIVDTQELIRGQIELTKAEVRDSMKQASNGSGLLVGAGVLGFLAFVFLLVAAAYGIVAAGLPVWAGFLIVAGALLLIAAILGLLGRKRLRVIAPPQRSIAAIEATKVALSERGQQKVPGTVG